MPENPSPAGIMAAAVTAALATCVLFFAPAAFAQPASDSLGELLVGKAAFGDWRTDAPLVRRKITDLQVIVRDLSHAGGRSVQRGHITRDIVFSKDDRQMFVSVGSASNDGEGIGKRDATAIARWEAEHGLGSAWGNETDRAAVLVFDPAGRNRRVFASGLRNCVGLAVHPRRSQQWEKGCEPWRSEQRMRNGEAISRREADTCGAVQSARLRWRCSTAREAAPRSKFPAKRSFCALGGTHLERTITTSTLRDSLRPR
jgi:hypothetical protein